MYTTTLSNNARIKVTHPYLSFYGKEYQVIEQYIRINKLFLRCVDEDTDKIITLPASFTDYYSVQPELYSGEKSHFTIQSLSEVDCILDCIMDPSTK